MAAIKRELKRWGFNFWTDNFWGDYNEIKVTKLLDKGELRVHEMVGLNVQWVEGDVINNQGIEITQIKFLLSDGVEGNGVVVEEDLPVLIRPSISFRHDVSTTNYNIGQTS